MTSYERVLLLDRAWRPVAVVSWMKAVVLLFQGRVAVVEEQDALIRSPSTTLRAPSVVRLNRAVALAWKDVRLSRRNVFFRDGFQCQYCGKQFPQHRLNLDHVIPRSRGGPTSWENVVTCCIEHNRRKGGRLPREAGLRLVRLPARPRWGPVEKLLAELGGQLPQRWRPYLGGSAAEHLPEATARAQ